MVRRGVTFTFPPELVREPFTDNPSQQLKVATNIRRGDVGGDKSRIILELGGEGRDIGDGIAWVLGRVVRVDSVGGDIVEN